MSIDNCRECGEPVDTDHDTDCYSNPSSRFSGLICYCPPCREKQPKTEFLARISMAVAQVMTFLDEGQIMARNIYWSRHTGGLTEGLYDYYSGRNTEPASGPYPDRATAREASRERAIAWFSEIEEQANGIAKDEAGEMMQRLKAA